MAFAEKEAMKVESSEKEPKKVESTPPLSEATSTIELPVEEKLPIFIPNLLPLPLPPSPEDEDDSKAIALDVVAKRDEERDFKWKEFIECEEEELDFKWKEFIKWEDEEFDFKLKEFIEWGEEPDFQLKEDSESEDEELDFKCKKFIECEVYQLKDSESEDEELVFQLKEDSESEDEELDFQLKEDSKSEDEEIDFQLKEDSESEDEELDFKLKEFIESEYEKFYLKWKEFFEWEEEPDLQLKEDEELDFKWMEDNKLNPELDFLLMEGDQESEEELDEWEPHQPSKEAQECKTDDILVQVKASENESIREPSKSATCMEAKTTATVQQIGGWKELGDLRKRFFLETFGQDKSINLVSPLSSESYMDGDDLLTLLETPELLDENSSSNYSIKWKEDNEWGEKLVFEESGFILKEDNEGKKELDSKLKKDKEWEPNQRSRNFNNIMLRKKGQISIKRHGSKILPSSPQSTPKNSRNLVGSNNPTEA